MSDTGIDISKLIQGAQEAHDKGIEAALRGMDLFGEHVIGDSQQLTPVDTGALAASGTTRPAKVEGDTIEKTIGHNTSYAAAVHEVTTNRHKQGQAKFLETAMNKNAPKLENFVGRQVQKALGGS